MPLLYTTTTSLIYIWSGGGGSSGVIFFSLFHFITWRRQDLTRTYTHRHISPTLLNHAWIVWFLYIDGNVNHYQHHQHQHIMYISNGILFFRYAAIIIWEHFYFWMMCLGFAGTPFTPFYIIFSGLFFIILARILCFNDLNSPHMYTCMLKCRSWKNDAKINSAVR